VAVVLVTNTPDAAAQGRGRPKAPKAPTGTTPAPAPTGTTSDPAVTADLTSASALPATSVAPVSFRQFGAWLDDASAPTPGEGRTGIGIGYWRVNGGSQTNLPMLDVGYGFTDRIQASASVPFYRVSYDGGTARGLDDMYLSAKVTLVDPTLTVSEFGLAVSPVVEVLSAGGEGGRVHFALPISMELRRSAFRVYGSAGYFTRGSVFTGGAVEFGGPMGLTMTGAVTQSYSTNEDATLDEVGIGRQRADATVGVAHGIGNIGAAYVSVGRTLTSIAEGGTSVSVAGGLSFRFSAPIARP
jgi:hypothetical protein